MADQGSSQWRGKGQTGVSRVNPVGVSATGSEGSFTLSSDGPYKPSQGASTARTPDSFTLSATVNPTQPGNSVARSATPRTLVWGIIIVFSGSSRESYTLVRVNV